MGLGNKETQMQSVNKAWHKGENCLHFVVLVTSAFNFPRKNNLKKLHSVLRFCGRKFRPIICILSFPCSMCDDVVHATIPPAGNQAEPDRLESKEIFLPRKYISAYNNSLNGIYGKYFGHDSMNGWKNNSIAYMETWGP